MSLLNQVLQDLDERAPVGEVQTARLSVAPVVHPVAPGQEDDGPDWVRLGVGILIIVTFVASVWVFYGPDEQEATEKLSSPPPAPEAVAGSTSTPVTEQPVEPVAEHGSIEQPGASNAIQSAAVSVMPTVPATEAVGDEYLPEAPSAKLAQLTTRIPTAAVAPAPVPQQKRGSAETETPELNYLPLHNTDLPVLEETPSETARVTPDSGMRVKTPKSPPPGPAALARAAIEQGELSSAESILQRRLRLAPGDMEARELLVGLMLRGGRYDTAAQQLDRGLKQHPGHVKFSLIRARLSAQSGEIGTAIRILESSAPSAAGRVERLQMLGALYQQQGRYEQAIDSYRELLDLNPDAGTAWVGLAICLDGLGDIAALEAYDRALRFGGLPAAAETYARQRFRELELTLD